MSEQTQDCTSEVTRIGRLEFTTIGGQNFKRVRGQTAWTEVDPLPEDEEALEEDDGHNDNKGGVRREAPTYLSLVRERQTDGAPDHWLLLIAREGEPGSMHQVTGDAEMMHYVAPGEPADPLRSEDFKDIFHLAALSKSDIDQVHALAPREPPPRAKDRRHVTENCQGWTVRVIAKLVASGIVPAQKLNDVKELLQPV